MLKYHVAVCDDEKSDLDGIVQSVQQYDVQGCFDIETYMDANNEKQEVPTGELPVVHIAIVCGLWQGASYSGAHPVFCFALNLLAHGFQPHSSNISPGHRSESNPHSPTDRCR